MKIKKLQIKDYKRFHDLTIDLGDTPNRIVALVGPNGCGKSSVFDAILFHINAYGTIGNSGTKDYTYHSLKSDPTFNWESIVIDFETGNFNEIRTLKSKQGKQNTIFSFRSPFRYNSELLISESKAVTELRLNSYGASTTSSIDSKMDENYRRLQIKYSNFLNTNDCKPSEAKAQIIGELNGAIQSCLNVKIENLGNIESGKGTLFFSNQDHSSAFAFNVLSSGEKEVIDILLDLYLRKEDYNDTVFLIDEPELHINTSIQRKLMIEIDKMIEPSCQLWIATHSIGFLRSLQEDLKGKSQIIEFSENNKWAAEAYTLRPVKYNRDTWKSLFSTALDDLSSLISPKRIIYCEGRAEPGRGNIELGLDAKVLNKIFSHKYSDSIFVSSGGNTELDQRSEIAFAILSKALIDIEILVLKDRDMASGYPTDENSRQMYLQNNPENHRVLKRWEIENYLFDKEVLSRYCNANNLCFNEESYNVYVEDIVNQNVKDSVNRMKNFCNIVGSINTESFKLKLSEYISEDMEIYKELEDVIFYRA